MGVRRTITGGQALNREKENRRGGKTPEAELKRKRTQKIILGLLGLVALLFINKLFLKGLTSPSPNPNNALIIILFNINIVLLIVLVLLAFRNLVKLYFEHRRRIMGARFRTKLMLAFVGFSLVPSVLLFLFASGLITGAIDRWFNIKVERSLDEALEVAQQFYRNSEKNALFHARRLSETIALKRMTEKENRVYLNNTLAKKREELGLDGLQVYSADFKLLAQAVEGKLPPGAFTNMEPAALASALSGEDLSDITSSQGGDVIRAAVPIVSPGAEADIQGVMVAFYYVPQGMVNRMRSITSAFEEYKQLKILKNPIKASYVITFLIITLLVIFAAIWFGFYLARGITVPIQELAKGTEAVAEGRLDYKIGFKSDDELGLLIDSFNKMTDDLRNSGLQVERANAELRSSNEELDRRRIYMETVLENITTGVISIDTDGRITTINQSAQSLLGLSSEEIRGEPYDEVYGSYSLYGLKLLVDRVNQGYPKKVEEQLQLTVNGNNLTLIVNVNPLIDERKQYRGKVVVLDDLTELMKAQRAAAWREVARRIAHEIKNPLTPIQLSTQRLRKKHKEGAEDYDKVFDECTKIIIQEVDELKKLVNEFSSFARMPEAKPEINDLHRILEDVVTLYQTSDKKVRLSTEFDSKISHIKVDKEQIKRAMINLIDNSMEAMEGGGEIVVKTSLNDELDVVKIEIKDWGRGIPAQDRDRLFMPYFSTKKGGTGLGLAIVSKIVSDHNGYIRVSDNHPAGTIMTIELPIDSRAQSLRTTV
jgi:two-component system nitrogen regulation sensor histidine kinase NtrY